MVRLRVCTQSARDGGCGGRHWHRGGDRALCQLEPGLVCGAGGGGLGAGHMGCRGETALRPKRQLKDPGLVVVDEVVGQWLALAGARTLNWKSYLGAFLLFRLFDIWKPPPVRQLEVLPGGVKKHRRRR